MSGGVRPKTCATCDGAKGEKPRESIRCWGCLWWPKGKTYWEQPGYSDNYIPRGTK